MRLGQAACHQNNCELACHRSCSSIQEDDAEYDDDDEDDDEEEEEKDDEDDWEAEAIKRGWGGSWGGLGFRGLFGVITTTSSSSPSSYNQLHHQHLHQILKVFITLLLSPPLIMSIVFFSAALSP